MRGIEEDGNRGGEPADDFLETGREFRGTILFSCGEAQEQKIVSVLRFRENHLGGNVVRSLG